MCQYLNLYPDGCLGEEIRWSHKCHWRSLAWRPSLFWRLFKPCSQGNQIKLLKDIGLHKNSFTVGLVENSCTRVSCCSSLWRPLDWHEWACKLHHRAPGGGLCRYLHCPITHYHKKWPICAICVTSANNINYPPYKPATVGSELADKTICGDHQHYWGSHYDTHNMYGYSESGATLDGNVYIIVTSYLML